MKKNVVFLIQALHGGGAERVFLNVCRYLDKSKFKVTLCLLKKEGDYIDLIPDNPGFHIHNLNVARVRYSVIPILNYLWKTKPHILISTLGHLNALLGAIAFALPKGIKVVGRESNIVSKSNHKKIILLLYKVFYKNFDKIIVQSTDMEADLKHVVKNLKKDQIVKINNPVDVERIATAGISAEKVLPKYKINLLSAGRLTYQKGYDILLKSFSKFENKEKYHLTILGKGVLKAELEQLAHELGVDKQVTFAGFQSNPYPYMTQASIFISSSRFEGFPNAVLEALACDTPVLANDYKGGIHEIIEDPLYGKVIAMENSKLFESACEALSTRTLPPQAISKAIHKRYGMEKIIQDYEALFQSL